MSPVRCRIAPSPSGFLHIGTAKMALFNWLFARKHDGTFILRLEDTDVERSDEAFAQAMLEGFRWLGIDWDEGPEFGDELAKGYHGPYRQSQRRNLHRKEAFRLLEEGKAYKCFSTQEEVEAIKQQARVEKKHAPFRSKWRNALPDEIEAMGDAPYVIRFKVPEGVTEVHDHVQGTVRADNDQFDDFVILKSSGDPVFHLAVVADDGTMEITHVIRGDDHLTNAYRHVMLFDALGYALPVFAHLPLVLDESGKKFSKREHGANVLDWREDGFLPEALINYVALLGWTPEEENRELFTREELIEAFTMDRWSKSAARFDRKRLEWINGQHVRMLDSKELRDRLVPILERNGFDTSSKSEAWLAALAAICQDKLPTLNRIVELADFFFREVTEYEEKAVRKQWTKAGARERMEQIRQAMTEVPESDWNRDTLKASFEHLIEETGEGMGKFVHPARLALTGKSVGPGLFELAELLGKGTCLARIDKAVQYIDREVAV